MYLQDLRSLETSYCCISGLKCVWICERPSPLEESIEVLPVGDGQTRESFSACMRTIVLEAMLVNLK
jgi:hypothetical protein